MRINPQFGEKISILPGQPERVGRVSSRLERGLSSQSMLFKVISVDWHSSCKENVMRGDQPEKFSGLQAGIRLSPRLPHLVAS